MSYYDEREPKRQRHSNYRRGGRDFRGGRGYHGGGGNQGGRGHQGRPVSGGHGGGGRRGGGRGGGKWGDLPRPSELRVLINFFQLSAPDATLQYFLQQKWSKYHLTIFDAFRRKKKDADGTYLEPWEFEIMPKTPRHLDGEKKTLDMDAGSNPISRRVLLTLQKRLHAEKKLFAVSACYCIYVLYRLMVNDYSWLTS